MNKTEQEFYVYLMMKIDADLLVRNIKVDELIKDTYIISRQTYFNMLKFSEGKKNARHISWGTMKKLCDHFGINIEQIRYVYSIK